MEEKVPLLIIEDYLKNGSLRKTAEKYNIHYNTLYKWVKLYRKGNLKTKQSEFYLSSYRKPWNRLQEEIEQKICEIKEKNPNITLKEIKKILEKENIILSIKGIWNVLKRYGYTGFKKENMTNEFTENIKWTKEAIRKYKSAMELYKSGRTKECIYILNSLPSLPKNELILKIPYKSLGLKRKLERLESEFGILPLSEYIKKIKYYEKILKYKKLYLSFLRLLTSEAILLEWKGEPKKIIEKVEKVLKECGNSLPFDIFFTLKISLAIAYTRVLEFKKAKRIANECYLRLIKRKHKSPYFLLDLATFYTYAGEFKKAEKLLLSALEKFKGDTKIFMEKLALINFMKGDYKKCLNFIKKSKLPEWAKVSRPLIYSSFKYLLEGQFQKSHENLKKAIEVSKFHDSYDVWICSLHLAIFYTLMGKIEEGRKILKEISSFLSKRGLLLEKYICDAIFNKDEISEDTVPILRIINLLKRNKYFSALNFAKSKGLLTYLYLTILLLPESVLKLLKKGKNPHLPRIFFKFPIFSRDKVIYEIYLLSEKFKIVKRFIQGDQVFTSQEIYPHLTHKEKAFLIYISFNLNEPGKKFRIAEITDNFWKEKNNPSYIFSKYLYKIKKELKIPPAHLEVIYKHSDPMLINNGIYFITDYEKFEKMLIQAKYLLHTGEWEKSRKIFISAFKTFKTAPFEKMYDDWSDFMRIKILNKYEKEILYFARECKNRNDYKTLKKVIKMAEKVLRFNPIENNGLF